jgi:hypothetical protein
MLQAIPKQNMAKRKLIVFTTNDDFARMLQLYFAARDFVVTVRILSESWTNAAVIKTCKNELPSAIIVWDYGSSEMMQLFNELKEDAQTKNVVVALLIMAWPDGLIELPDYAFVHPFQIDKVESYIVTECTR